MSGSNRKQVPKWMLKSSGSESNKNSATLNKGSPFSKSEVPKRVRSKKTVYCMTEKELLETAKQIMIQAGKEYTGVNEDKTLLETESATGNAYPATISHKSKNTRLESRLNESEDSYSYDDLFTTDSSTEESESGLKTSSETKTYKRDLTEKTDNSKKHKPDLSILDEIFL